MKKEILEHGFGVNDDNIPLRQSCNRKRKGTIQYCALKTMKDNFSTLGPANIGLCL